MNWDECAIVDDNKFDRLICTRIVARINAELEVKNFVHGKEILDYLLSDSFTSSHLLIFLDINMPIMNGYEFLDELSKDQYTILRERVSIVIITSSTRKEDYEQTIQYPSVNTCLQKPISLDTLRKIIEKTP